MISLLRNLEVEQRSQEWAAEHCFSIALLQRYDSRGAHRSKRICFSISLVSQVQQDALYQAGLLVPLDVPVASAGGSAAQPRFGLRPIAADLGARKLQTGAFSRPQTHFRDLGAATGWT